MIYFESDRFAETLWPALKSLFTNPGEFFEQMPLLPAYRHGIFLASLTIFVFAALYAFHSMVLLFLFPVIWAAFLLFVWLWSRYLSWAMRTIPRLPMPRLLAFNMTSYCMVPLALLAIPYVGWLGLVGSVYLMWLALVRRGKVNGATALMITVVPTVILVVAGAAAWIGAMSIQIHLVD